ncbi:RAM signaling network component [Branchiostoma belcheri]|nr:RAM signaling network component [Branchiostoma belcheri]
MGRKLLIFLLIILKEPDIPEADCSCAPSSHCECSDMRLSSIPQNLPTSILSLDVGSTSVTQHLFNLLETAKMQNATVTSTFGYHWFFTHNAGSTAASENKSKTKAILNRPIVVTSDKPESAPMSSEPVLIGSVVGIALIGVIILTVWYMIKTRQPPLGPNVVSGIRNTPASTGGNQYGDINNPRDQTGQGQSQANTESSTNTTATVMTGGDAHQYDDIDNTLVKTGQDQSQANTESITNTTATVMTSDDAHVYDDIDNTWVKTGQGQSRANTESSTNTTTTVVAGGDDQTGQGQYQPLIKSKNTVTVMASDDNQTVQGQYQATIESIDTRNPFYDTGPTASQLNTLYKTATVVARGHDLTRQGQSQATTESITNTEAMVMVRDHNNMGHGQYRANTETPSRHEVLAALQPNPMYEGVKTAPKDEASTEMANSHDQTKQDQS